LDELLDQTGDFGLMRNDVLDNIFLVSDLFPSSVVFHCSDAVGLATEWQNAATIKTN